MKPTHLTLQAFGPFPTTATVDFDLGGRSYRIRRVPKQGTTTHAVDLYDRTGRTGDGQHLQGGVRAVGERVAALLRLDSKQYRQTSMLPQGEFRKVITGNSADREVILRNLFDTGAHRDLQDKLIKAAKRSREDLQTAETRVETLLKASEVESTTALADRLSQADAELKASTAALKTLTKERDDASAALEAGRKAEEVLQALKTARDHLKALEAQAPEQEKERQALARHDKGATVEPLIQHRNQRAAEAATSQSRLQTARQAEQEASGSVQETQAALTQERARDPQRDALQKRVHDLDELAKVGLSEAQDAQTTAKQDAEGADKELLDAKATTAAATVALESATQAVDDTTQIAQRKEEARLRLDELDRRLTQHQRRVELQAQHTQAEADRTEATRTLKERQALAQRARDHEAQSLKDYIAGLAGKLAHTLEDGEPCPVCGSHEHPDKAASASATDDDALQAAQAARSDAEEALGDARTQAEAARGRVQDLAAQRDALPQEADADALKQQRDAAAKDLDAAEKARQSLTEQQAQKDRASAAVDTATKAQDTAEGAQKEAHERLAKATARLEERLERIPKALRAPGAIAAARQIAEDDLTALREALKTTEEEADQAKKTLVEAETKRKAAEREVDEADGHHQKAVQDAKDALAQAGFTDEQDWTRARLTDAETRREALTAWDEERVEARAVLATAEASAAGVTSPELTQLEERDSSAKTALSEAQQRHGELTSGRDATAHALTDLKAAERALKTAEAEHQAIGKLARAARGDNRQKLPFERYVLGSFLDEVLGQANARLHKMTGGRFTLHRSDQVGGHRAGLDLAVEDLHTGTRRRAATLSGGEGFQAAMSLALGLADTVQARSGGVHMDSLFIDEGFGSLGEEDLDRVLTTLEEMGAGRMIGLISHVRELRDRIPTRVEVVKSPNGSRIQTSV